MGSIVFAVFAGVLMFVLNKRLGMSYFDDIHTLSSLQDRLPLIFLVTGLFQMSISGAVMAILSLYWGHAVSGPIVRFRKGMRSVVHGKVDEMIFFRKNDQLHDLARSFNNLQKNMQTQKNQLQRYIDEADRLAADCERLKKGSDTMLLQRKHADLIKIYRDMERLVLERGTVD